MSTSPPLLRGIRRVCIIGAGAAGLSFCKYLKAEGCFTAIDVYESMTEVGGAWNYTPVVSSRPLPAPTTIPHAELEEPIWENGNPVFPTPMYTKLRTNIPKSLMQYSDFPFSGDADLFPDREVVQKYLVGYSTEIRSHIKFSTQVREVKLNITEKKNEWTVTLRDLNSGVESNQIYDAIVAANGHYTTPFIPSIQGLSAWKTAYPEAIQHSKFYKSPEAYRNKKVVVVGNAASGADIGSQIVKVCKQPMFWSIRTPTDAFGHDERLEVTQIKEFIVEERAVRFEDGRIEKDVDAVLFCTGYLYAFPFLDSITPLLVTDGRRVRGLYKQLLHIEHPTLVFPILAQKILPFPMSEFQAAAVSRLWSGRITLPSKEDMIQWERKRVEQRGDATAFHAFEKGEDETYAQDLVNWINSANPSEKGKTIEMWDEKHSWVRANFAKIRLDYAKKVGAKNLEEVGWDFEAHKKAPVAKEDIRATGS